MTQLPVLPNNVHDKTLLTHVHPENWHNPRPAGRYHLVVIGAGTAGLVAAAGAAALGAKVALVERGLMGGECLNVGCVPSKALLAAARVAATVRDAAAFGVRVHGGEVDFAAVMERMRRLRAEISPHDSAERFRHLGVEVFFGAARFTGPDTVEVGGERLHFARAIIATGTRPQVPSIPGLPQAGFVTNETLFNLTELPRRLVVLGAGPIGCELAQAFARFGAQVTVLDVAAQILPREDADAAALVQGALERDGVRFHLASRVEKVEVRGGAKVLAVVAAAGPHEIAADEILVAAGRTPVLDGLNLPAAGVRSDEKSGILVDDRLRTSNQRIFAAGDVCSPYRFTHAAEALARVAVQNALFPLPAHTGALVIPWCTYTDPEVARVGLNAREAKEQGRAVDTYSLDLKEVDRAVLDGDPDGFARVHVRRGTDRIVGATVVARHAGELLAPVTQAMTAGHGLRKLGRVIHPYPTRTDIMRRIADRYNRARLTPAVRWLLARWLAWAR